MWVKWSNFQFQQSSIKMPQKSNDSLIGYLSIHISQDYSYSISDFFTKTLNSSYSYLLSVHQHVFQMVTNKANAETKGVITIYCR